MIDEIMLIEKGGCGSSHGGAQAASPTNIDLPLRLGQENRAPSDSTKRKRVGIILGTKRRFVF